MVLSADADYYMSPLGEEVEVLLEAAESFARFRCLRCRQELFVQPLRQGNNSLKRPKKRLHNDQPPLPDPMTDFILY